MKNNGRTIILGLIIFNPLVSVGAVVFLASIGGPDAFAQQGIFQEV